MMAMIVLMTTVLLEFAFMTQLHVMTIMPVPKTFASKMEDVASHQSHGTIDY